MARHTTSDEALVAFSNAPGRHARPLSPVEQRLARLIYGHEQAKLCTVRRLNGSPAELLAAVGRVFPNEPYQLRLVDYLYGPSAPDGARVFKVLAWKDAPLGDALRFRVRLKTVFLDHLTLRIIPHETADDCSELAISGDLQHEIRIGTRWFLVPLTVAGAIGGALGLHWLAMRQLPPGDPTSVTVLIAGAAAGAVAGATTLAIWGRSAIGKARKELDGLLAATELALRQPQADPGSVP